jgi:hypothetical protein
MLSEGRRVGEIHDRENVMVRWMAAWSFRSLTFSVRYFVQYPYKSSDSIFQIKAGLS